jgi:transcriptional regulator with XRE-family HTH domain
MTPKEFREKIGLSQREMAAKLKTTQATICRLENGDHTPSARVAQAYHIASRGQVRLQHFPAVKGAA